MSTSLRVETDFAPAERLTSSRLSEQFDAMMEEGRLTEVLDASPNFAMVTNITRQIIYANTRLQTMLEMSADEIRGKRPGEILACPNALEHPGGCGTSKNCRFCGVVHVLLEAMGSGITIEREARMFTYQGDKYVPFDVKVTATPMSILKDRYLLVFLEDISSIKKRERLERTFFHDVMNTAGGLKNLAMYLAETGGTSNEKAAKLIVDQSDLLIDEIRSQQLLVDAESDNLAVTSIDTRALILFTEARTAGEVLKEAKDRTIDSVMIGEDRGMCIDSVLVKRALLNVLKNALEATPPGGIVHFRTVVTDDTITFHVCNDGVMDDAVKSQIFQRSFSTKGPGRGIGTYSLRLIVEHYLGGHVSFISNAETGTEFRVSLPLNHLSN